MKWNLEREPAQYNYIETIARTFIIPAHQNQIKQESKFNNTPIRRIAVAMNTNSVVIGSFKKNLFRYQKFLLRELRTIRGGRAFVSLDTTSPFRPYVTTRKVFTLVFYLISLHDAAEQNILEKAWD